MWEAVVVEAEEGRGLEMAKVKIHPKRETQDRVMRPSLVLRLNSRRIPRVKRASWA